MSNVTLMCLEVTRHTGTSKPKDGSPGRAYDFYTGFYKDTLTGKVGKFNTSVIDGLNPPIVGQEYPVQFQIYVNRANEFIFRPVLDPTYVS